MVEVVEVGLFFQRARQELLFAHEQHVVGAVGEADKVREQFSREDRALGWKIAVSLSRMKSWLPEPPDGSPIDQRGREVFVDAEESRDEAAFGRRQQAVEAPAVGPAGGEEGTQVREAAAGRQAAVGDEGEAVAGGADRAGRELGVGAVLFDRRALLIGAAVGQAVPAPVRNSSLGQGAKHGLTGKVAKVVSAPLVVAGLVVGDEAEVVGGAGLQARRCGR